MRKITESADCLSECENLVDDHPHRMQADSGKISTGQDVEIRDFRILWSFTQQEDVVTFCATIISNKK